jgi:hypothetical protein
MVFLILLFIHTIVISANYNVAREMLYKQLQMHAPRHNLNYMYCIQGEEGITGLPGSPFQNNQIESGIKQLEENGLTIVYECNPKRDVEDAYELIKSNRVVNSSFPQGPLGPMGDIGYSIQMYLSNFYFTHCIESNIPRCNYTIQLFNEFYIRIDDNLCPNNLEGWMGTRGARGIDQIKFVGNFEEFKQKVWNKKKKINLIE